MASDAVEAGALFFVAPDTPTHLKRSYLFDNLHVLNLPVTRLAIEAGIDMRFVGKVSELWGVVNFDPFNRIVFVVFFGEPLDRFLIGRNDLVTPHAGIHGWDTSRCCPACCRVAVFTRNFPLAGMKRVAEWNWLRWLVANIVNRVSWSPHPPGKCVIGPKGRRDGYQEKRE